MRIMLSGNDTRQGAKTQVIQKGSGIRPEASSTKATKRLASSAPEEWRLPLPIKMAYTNTGKTQRQREKKTQTRREKNTDKDIVDKII